MKILYLCNRVLLGLLQVVLNPSSEMVERRMKEEMPGKEVVVVVAEPGVGKRDQDTGDVDVAVLKAGGVDLVRGDVGDAVL